MPALTDFACLPREAYFSPAVLVPLQGVERGVNPALVGAVSADQVVPYPPGIPVLVPGQRISEEIATFLCDLFRANAGIEIHGLVTQGDAPCLRVVRGLS